MRRLAVALCLAPLAGCALHPVAVDPTHVEREVGERYRAFFPDDSDPDPRHDAGLLRPRFGLPAIVRAGAPFEITLLERNEPFASLATGSPRPEPRAALAARSLSDGAATRCLAGSEPPPGCDHLLLVRQECEPIDDGLARCRFLAQPSATPALGGHDLLVASAVDGPTRAPHAVWIMADDPDAPRPIHIVQLSDLHVGRTPASSEPKMREVLRDVDALAPDLVVVTGDVTDLGTDGAQAPRARDFLLGLHAPVLVINGGHDIGLGVKVRRTRQYGAGWEHFASTFHSYLYFKVQLAGWDFIGFDTGPSVLPLGALDRGVSPEAVARIAADVRTAERSKRRGVVLFSHAPTRATVHNYGQMTGRGSFGRMYFGGDSLETLMLEAAARGERIIHLSGHTHWSDVFESQVGPRGMHFQRLREVALSACLVPLRGRAALINTQSATLIGVPLKETARGYGFSEMWLDAGNPQLAYHHYRSGRGARRCVPSRLYP